ncbi:glutathione binding-like protein [Novosphingobium sp.]|uniref:glutathione S-transferase family protein n=1 Tax=Novosphingobium sp. TaxID=1874826 RepID=UPI0028AAD8BB|nr:glutathione binding-like protein [Novosphingobium sp.]
MIDLYFSSTPNGIKVLIFLEEFSIAYKANHVSTLAGEQFTPEFLRISPNAKIPAIVDQDPSGRSGPINVFESGAILLYLAGKLPSPSPLEAADWPQVISWLFWQMASLGPVSGQRAHFDRHAPPSIDKYALDRFDRELARLYTVLDIALQDREFVGDSFSIADIAIYPWLRNHEMLGRNLDAYPSLLDWFTRVTQRPSVVKAYALAAEHGLKWPENITEEQRRLLFACTEEDMRDAYNGKIAPWPDNPVRN